jgi:hypothetical protein
MVRGDRALHAAAEVAGHGAEGFEWMLKVEFLESLQLVADGLEAFEGDEQAHDVVGALEDGEDADVAQDLLVGLVADVGLAAGELEGPVGGVPDELRGEERRCAQRGCPRSGISSPQCGHGRTDPSGSSRLPRVWLFLVC